MKKKHIFKSVRGRNCIIDYYDQMLNTYLDNTKQYYLNTSYGSTFSIEAGEKDSPPIVLLHGSGMSSSMWLNDLEKYSKKNADLLFQINPSRICKNQPILRLEPIPFTGYEG